MVGKKLGNLGLANLVFLPIARFWPTNCRTVPSPFCFAEELSLGGLLSSAGTKGLSTGLRALPSPLDSSRWLLANRRWLWSITLTRARVGKYVGV